MLVLALTGGIGSGKSVAAEYFRSRGAVTLDLDRIAAQTLAPGSPTLAKVAEAFGDSVVQEDGSLDRTELARVAFASPEATERLNSIVHPVITREVGPAIADLRLLPDPPNVVVLEVPLLVEVPVYAELADVVLALVAPEQVRLSRAIERGMSPEDASRRMRLQATDAERASLADRVIVNDGSREHFLSELARFWDEFLGNDGAHSAHVPDLDLE